MNPHLNQYIIDKITNSYNTGCIFMVPDASTFLTTSNDVTEAVILINIRTCGNVPLFLQFDKQFSTDSSLFAPF